MKFSKHLFIIMACFFIMAPSILFAADKIILANGEWAPYLGKTLKNGGPTTHVVTEAFKLEGIEVEYKWYGDSWKRAYHDALAGKKAQGTLVWSKKPGREKEMYYSDSLLIPGQKTVFFHLKNKPFEWQTIQDLKGLKIGGRLGYSYGEAFDSSIDKGIFKLERTDKENVNFKKLLAGRINLIVMIQKVGEEYLKKELAPEQAAQISFHPKPVRISGYHLLLTKTLPGNEELMKKFDDGFKKLVENGTFDKIMAGQ